MEGPLLEPLSSKRLRSIRHESAGGSALGLATSPGGSAVKQQREAVDGHAARGTVGGGVPRAACAAARARDASQPLLQSAEGTVVTVAGGDERGFLDGRGDLAKFDGPVGIAAARDGSLLIADMFNNRIRRVRYVGLGKASPISDPRRAWAVSTVAGCGEHGFADGEGSLARFAWPAGAVLMTRRPSCSPPPCPAAAGSCASCASRDGASDNEDAIERLLVADTANDRVRVVSLRLRADGDGDAESCMPAAAAPLAAPGNGARESPPPMGAVVSTAAGSGADGGDDGPAAFATFSFPFALAVSPRDGTVYVSEYQDDRLRTISPGGNVATVMLDGAPELGAPEDAAAKVRSAARQLTGSAAVDVATARHMLLNQPRGVALGEAGGEAVLGGGAKLLHAESATGELLYVVDSTTHSISACALPAPPPASGVLIAGSAAGESGWTDGGPRAARFAAPSSIAVAADATLFIADTLNNAVRVVAAHADGGAVRTLAGGGAQATVDGRGECAAFDRPRGLCLDEARRILWVTESGGNCVRAISVDASSQRRARRRMPLVTLRALAMRSRVCVRDNGDAADAAAAAAPNGAAASQLGEAARCTTRAAVLFTTGTWRPVCGADGSDGPHCSDGIFDRIVRFL